jgi:hypothetical protein
MKPLDVHLHPERGSTATVVTVTRDIPNAVNDFAIVAEDSEQRGRRLANDSDGAMADRCDESVTSLRPTVVTGRLGRPTARRRLLQSPWHHARTFLTLNGEHGDRRGDVTCVDDANSSE